MEALCTFRVMKVTYLSAETGNFGVLRVPVDLLQKKGHQGGQAHDRLVALILALLWKKYNRA